MASWYSCTVQLQRTVVLHFLIFLFYFKCTQEIPQLHACKEAKIKALSWLDALPGINFEPMALMWNRTEALIAEPWNHGSFPFSLSLDRHLYLTQLDRDREYFQNYTSIVKISSSEMMIYYFKVCEFEAHMQLVWKKQYNCDHVSLSKQSIFCNTEHVVFEIFTRCLDMGGESNLTASIAISSRDLGLTGSRSLISK